RVHIRTLLFFLLIGVFPIPAWMYLAFALAKDLVFVDWVDDGVARAAHLGGWFFGATVSMILLKLHLIRREPYDLFMIGRQAARRRELREATRQQSRRVERAMTRSTEAVQRQRSMIATAVGRGDMDAATNAWLDLARAHGRDQALVPRDQQYRIARHLVERGDHPDAALAIERFIEAHPRDPETPSMRLLLGLICLRYLNDPVRAKVVLAEARDTVRDPDEREFAMQLLEEAG
ncbi:MAG: tetratricopeptide repeat protein, partial [Phycisphaerales bacterium]|nr:tetratricopeptide repeat protein [Phycisphaerales bacterium]